MGQSTSTEYDLQGGTEERGGGTEWGRRLTRGKIVINLLFFFTRLMFLFRIIQNSAIIFKNSDVVLIIY